MPIHYTHPDLGDDPQPDPFARIDWRLCEEIDLWLRAKLPRHWHIFTAWVSHAQGVALIRMPMLMGGTNCSVLHIDVLQIGPSAFHNAMREATGDLLSRYELSRGRDFDDDAFVQAVRNIPRLGLDARPVPG